MNMHGGLLTSANVSLSDSKMHEIIKKMGVIDKILGYCTECVHRDGKVSKDLSSSCILLVSSMNNFK